MTEDEPNGWSGLLEPTTDARDPFGGFSDRGSEPPPAPSRSGEVTRGSAIELDASAGTPFELAELWNRLSAGSWRVRDVFSTGDRLFAVTEQNERTPRRRGTRGAAMTEQVLLGQSAKSVAIERRVSDSAVALAIKVHLGMMGLRCRVRGVPHIVVMAARAARMPGARQVRGRIALVPNAERISWVVSVVCPDLSLLDALSAAERSVLLQLLEGKSYVQIAGARQTSTRTVANQVGTAFRKLGVSGHGQTLDRLMSRTLSTPPREARA
ncbi:MAG TPA: helix-turn-helix transcriptional regulator [Polyangiaceae bacterium]|nr:helix-turn-helix transcriptional regulator [Polyangiaceae bacterium]